ERRQRLGRLDGAVRELEDLGRGQRRVRGRHQDLSRQNRPPRRRGLQETPYHQTQRIFRREDQATAGRPLLQRHRRGTESMVMSEVAAPGGDRPKGTETQFYL